MPGRVVCHRLRCHHRTAQEVGSHHHRDQVVTGQITDRVDLLLAILRGVDLPAHHSARAVARPLRLTSGRIEMVGGYRYTTSKRSCSSATPARTDGTSRSRAAPPCAYGHRTHSTASDYPSLTCTGSPLNLPCQNSTQTPQPAIEGHEPSGLMSRGVGCSAPCVAGRPQATPRQPAGTAAVLVRPRPTRSRSAVALRSCCSARISTDGMSQWSLRRCFVGSPFCRSRAGQPEGRHCFNLCSHSHSALSHATWPLLVP